MERYICIHGHFYQPPRENPWLEAIELQDSAYPYHDWNERITAECYAPNAVSRILDERGRIVRIINNYARISFNFGPTLLSWLRDHAPDTYRAVLDADRESRDRFSGHGSALAQAYNHMIMPLATARDRRTQVRWGLRDFEHRFGRRPEGMWLPETAVDLDTLEALAEQDIAFTILAPHQAARVRELGGAEWRDVSGGAVDPTRAYLQRLPSGRSIAVFFYDGPVSRAVAFEELLRNGERFANRLVGTFSQERSWPQLVHIATDGETYGHHHRHGEMALAYALEHIQDRGQARLTNYGEYLERHPPTHEVEILENTSWSCAHGIERWRSDCGCRTGGEPGWHQAWRRPLRSALDWLRDTVAPLYEEAAGALLRDPWAARDDYIEVILNRSPGNRARFFDRHAVRPLGEPDEVRAFKLLELQRHAMLMYTSCGWFFNEVSGIETVQVLQYAGRVVQLAGELFDRSVEAPFLERLAEAKSNVPSHGDGRRIYERMVRPAMVDLPKVAAHYAISSLFEPAPEDGRVYGYSVTLEEGDRWTAGKARLGAGRVRVTSEITRESSAFSFGVLYFGDHNVAGGVRAYRAPESYQQFVDEVTELFDRADFPAVLRRLDQAFQGRTFSIKSLFRDEQRRVLDQILTDTLTDAEEAYHRVYDQHAPLMRFLADMDIPLPPELALAAEFVLNLELTRAVTDPDLDTGRIRSLLDEAQRSQVSLDTAGLGYALQGTLESLSDRLAQHPANRSRLERLAAAVELVRSLPFEVNLWEVQNVYYDLLQTVYPEFARRAGPDAPNAAAWERAFRELGAALSVAVEAP